MSMNNWEGPNGPLKLTRILRMRRCTNFNKIDNGFRLWPIKNSARKLDRSVFFSFFFLLFHWVTSHRLAIGRRSVVSVSARFCAIVHEPPSTVTPRSFLFSRMVYEPVLKSRSHTRGLRDRWPNVVDGHCIRWVRCTSSSGYRVPIILY